MDVAESDFNRIISEFDIQFVVPNWQRLYSWEYKEWNDLWEDLLNLLEKMKLGQPFEHFLGPVVLKTVEEKVGEITKRIVIDGQQRLTTLLLVCATLRDLAKRMNNPTLAEQIETSIMFNTYAKKPEYRPKLVPSEADRKAYAVITEGSDNADASDGSQLYAGYHFYEPRLRASLEKYSIEEILKAIRKLKMVTINLRTEDNPNRIFETLNFRGKDLEQVDLVRNYFMMVLGGMEKADKVYRTLWYPMQESLGANPKESIENLDAFLRHFAVMNRGDSVRADMVYAELRDGLKYAEEKQIVDELARIASFSRYYKLLLFPQNEKSQRIRTGIERLNRLEIGVHYPFLLKAYRLRNEGALTEDSLVGILDCIESYYVRRLIKEMPTQGLNRFFASLCRLPEDDLLGHLRNEMLAKSPGEALYWPDDHQFKEAFKSNQLYHSADRCRFILESLEEDLGHPEPVNLRALTIEHVMPETITNDWKRYLGVDWEKIYNKYVHTIANLTLIATQKNPSVGQKLYAEKKELWYKQSNVGLTKEILKWDKWTALQMEQRADLLAERATRIWERPA